MRNDHPQPLSGLPDRFTLGRLNLPAVERECDFFAHRVTSSEKNFITARIGFGAACPSPQIEASAITCESSDKRLMSHLGSAMSLTAFSQPTRQGVHCPQDSSAKNLRRFTATARMSSLSERMTTACDPTKQPYFSNWPKSSGRSAIEAGRMPPEAPPGR